MSDWTAGPGWWQASDGRWYPPETQPGVATRPPQYPSSVHPPYGSQTSQPQKNNGCLRALAIGAGATFGVIGVLVVVGFIAGALMLRGADKTPKKVGQVSPEATAPALSTTSTPHARFKIGDVIESGNWRLVVHSVTNPYVPPKDQFGFQQPAHAGMHYVAADIEVTNTTQQVQQFLILLLDMEDPAGHRFGPTLFLQGPEFPGHNVDPGTSRRGRVGFEVPNTANSLDLVFSDSPFVPAVHIVLT